MGAGWLLREPYLYRFTGDAQKGGRWELEREGLWAEPPHDVELAFIRLDWLQGLSAFNWIAMADDTGENRWRFLDYLPDGARESAEGTGTRT